MIDAQLIDFEPLQPGPADRQLADGHCADRHRADREGAESPPTRSRSAPIAPLDSATPFFVSIRPPQSGPAGIQPRRALDYSHVERQTGMSRALFDSVENKRTIIDRRTIADSLAAIPTGRDRNGFAAKLLRAALEQGRAEVARRLTLEPDAGRSAARATAYLHDQIVRLAYDFVAGDADVPTDGRSSASAAPAAARWRRSATSI